MTRLRPFARRAAPRFAACFLLGGCALSVHADSPSLETIMADPDWIGPPVEAAWWQLDGEAAVYRVKRAGTERRDLRRVTSDGRTDERVLPAQQAALHGPDPVLDADRRRALYVREGSLFLLELASGTRTQITAGRPTVDRPRFSPDGDTVHFRRAGVWHAWDRGSGVLRALTDLRLEADPNTPKEDSPEPDQLRLFRVLADTLAEDRAAHAEAIEAAAGDPARAVPPWYLGDGHHLVDSTLSADGRWLFAVVEEGDGSPSAAGARDRMPAFVTRSGYVEVEDVRRLVGRDPSKGQALWLLDLATRRKHEIDLSLLSGVDEDPLVDLKAAQEIDPHDADDPRPVRVLGIRAHPRDAVAAVMLRAVDNKDRWLVTIDAVDADGGEAPALVERDRLTDPAWINYRFNGFGWIPGTRELWFQSERSGYAHLYRTTARGRVRAVTEGAWEVHDVVFAPDGRTALLRANRSHPTEYDLWRVTLDDGALERETELLGLESFAVHPTSGDVLLRHSAPYVPTQLSRLDADTGMVTALTDTRTDAYAALSWQAPTLVPIPSRHDAPAPIWTKFYPARAAAPGGGAHPLVVFVHGAGYTQNTHHRFPYYFREQMFHNLLTDRGYHVLDMDYRASMGYGRDWRTAIYRQMGTPELEDLLDGIAWAVETHGADAERVGVYGGSYGGFMAFMALFNAPQAFAAGAALRPVTDWASYNHGYTSNILNTPQVDPEAYARSSPIEFAEGLEDDLLIAHGMLDDNVFYKDSVRIAQRLIELGKEDWELASYPVEPHAFIRADSWLDEYRRVLKLFERTLGTRADAETTAR